MPRNELRRRGVSRAIALLGATSLLGGCAHRFNAEGIVVRAAADGAQITVSHDAIPGFMDAMVMPFTVRKPAALPAISPGERIRFRLVVTGSGSYIEGIQVLSPARTDAGLLRSPMAPVLTPIGANVPDFSLVEASGKRLALSDLRGQVVLITFIYTRCPLPDFCPLQMAHFKEVKARLHDLIGREVTLLTITFDPRYDTPEVMRGYGAAYGADGHGWSLLTGTAEEIQKVTETFGLEFWPEEGLITHTLQTAVIDREGRLYATLEGKGYSIDQLVDVTSQALRARP